MSQPGAKAEDCNHSRVIAYEVESDEEIGRGRYLRLRRVSLRNRRDDGTLSKPYFCELVDRPRHGTDAVVVGLWRRGASGVEVLLRFGRSERLPVPDAAEYLYLTEVVAGILEDEDVGEEGILRRAAIEAMEEAGLDLPAAAFSRLGGKVFPTPGMAPECFHLVHAEVPPGTRAQPPAGDGSPMEEGSRHRFVPLGEALALCDRGEIEDAKTELLLRRLQARLAQNS
jgi:ADP-ribose pyrophosphatase